MSLRGLTPAPAIEEIHGVTIVDSYRWLEDRTSVVTQQWLEEQKRAHDHYFGGIRGIDVLRSRINEYLNIDAIDQPAIAGNSYFFRHRKKNQEQACLCVQNIVTGAERILVDPSEQGPFVSVSIHRISGDGKLLAYGLRHGGEGVEEIHFVHVESGQIFDDYLEAGHLRGLAFASDDAGFFYCHETRNSTQKNLPHAICYHRFGQSADHDQELISMPRTQRSNLVLISDCVNLGAVFVREDGLDLKVDLHISSLANGRPWHPVFTGKTPPYRPFLHNGRIYILSWTDCPNGQVVELCEGGVEELIVPEWEVPVLDLRFSTDCLYISYLLHGNLVIHRRSWNGTELEPLPAHPEGSFRLLSAYRDSDNTLFFAHESFSTPPSIFILSEDRNFYTLWARPSMKERTDFVQRVEYPSKDGTSIPLWLVAHDPIEPGKLRPTILTGYGGFGISMTPRFSVLVALMLDLGCIFALPCVRGGSEFGPQWHEAARKRNRQVAYDDFLAGAEWLCACGYTKPASLAIFGGSNSGLLVAAVMTQKPWLFKAVLCIAPILDMLRYEHFGNARKWQGEYGSVSDEEDFRALYAYSPCHHVANNIDYPASLFVSGDKDEQCDAAHACKMVALLQGRDAQQNPIVLDYSPERGHAPALPLSVRIDALTRRVAFLCHELGIAVPTEKSE
jgi:prolyl oligopeptidase